MKKSVIVLSLLATAGLQASTAVECLTNCGLTFTSGAGAQFASKWGADTVLNEKGCKEVKDVLEDVIKGAVWAQLPFAPKGSWQDNGWGHLAAAGSYDAGSLLIKHWDTYGKDPKEGNALKAVLYGGGSGAAVSLLATFLAEKHDCLNDKHLRALLNVVCDVHVAKKALGDMHGATEKTRAHLYQDLANKLGALLAQCLVHKVVNF